MGIKFTGVRKTPNGNITHIRTNAGKILTLQEAQVLARRGQVDSLTDIHADGTWEIADAAGEAQYREDTNLDALPEF